MSNSILEDDLQAIDEVRGRHIGTANAAQGGVAWCEMSEHYGCVPCYPIGTNLAGKVLEGFHSKRSEF